VLGTVHRIASFHTNRIHSFQSIVLRPSFS
jgi:hypothetical protein